MARIKGALNARKKHNRVLKLAKGYRGARSKQYFAGRKQKKRQMRSLWIVRINAAARMNGISYSQLMHGLKEAGVEINRKMLAELAVNDAAGFTALTDVAKKAIA